MKRPHDCMYDDSSKMSRTQSLRDREAALRLKILELEKEGSDIFGDKLCDTVGLESEPSEGSHVSRNDICESVTLSAEIHSTLCVVVHKKIVYASTDCSKVFKPLSDITGKSVSTQTLVDSIHHLLLQSFNAPLLTLP